ncbi:hypothetical protein HDU89_000693 [Geranomyces variabilis]|nr:hypothetical protein HDU89_000693 [Geranomyces variabilis]
MPNNIDPVHLYEDTFERLEEPLPLAEQALTEYEQGISLMREAIAHLGMEE